MSSPFPQSDYILTTCQLRPLTPAEAPAIGQTLAQIPPWQTLNYSAEALSSYLSQPDAALTKFAMVVADQPQGIICVRYPCLRGAYLELFAIYSSCQRQGMGREVINWLETELKRMKCRNLWVLVSSFNISGQQFYNAMGFSKIGDIPGLVVPEHTEILLRKVII